MRGGDRVHRGMGLDAILLIKAITGGPKD